MSIPIIGIACGFRTTPGETPLRDEIYLPARYLAPIVDAGGMYLPLVPTGDAELQNAQLDRVDGLLLIGGDDIPGDYFGEADHPAATPLPRQRVDFELAIARRAVELRKPLLGICCGEQMLNVAFGGSILQDIESLVPDAIPHRDPDTRRATSHPVTVDPCSRLAGIAGATEFKVCSAHHQSVHRLGAGWHTVATSADGIVEAIELQNGSFGIGVQWHPELTPDDPVTQHLCRAFVAAAGGTL